MSRVTNILMMPCSEYSDGGASCKKFNLLWAQKKGGFAYGSWFNVINHAAGGNKNLEMDTWASAANYIDFDAFRFAVLEFFNEGEVVIAYAAQEDDNWKFLKYSDLFEDRSEWPS